jgi:hypothetical protein
MARTHVQGKSHRKKTEEHPRETICKGIGRPIKTDPCSVVPRQNGVALAPSKEKRRAPLGGSADGFGGVLGMWGLGCSADDGASMSAKLSSVTLTNSEGLEIILRNELLKQDDYSQMEVLTIIQLVNTTSFTSR